METTPIKISARDKILAAATDLFYRNGIHATGIDTVIEAADVARMTLYKHFPSKDALIEAVLREASENTIRSMRNSTGDKPLSPRNYILAIFDWQAGRLYRDDFRGCQFFNAVVECADSNPSNKSVAVKFKSLMRDEIAGAVSKLGVQGEDMLTEQICLLMDGASTRAQMGFAAVAVPAARKAAELLIDAAIANKVN